MKKSSKNSIMLFTAFEYGFAMFAFALFAYNSILTLQDYLEEKTGLNQYLTKEPMMHLPAMTICPTNLYKETNSNATTMLSNITRYVYDLDDIFGDAFLNQIDDWIINEVFSVNMGRCFTIKKKEPINEYSFTYIFFKDNQTLKIYFHEAGNDYWTQASMQPVPYAEITFSTFVHEKNNNGNLRVLLKKFHHRKVNRKQFSCQLDATFESYTQCAFQELAALSNESCSSLLSYGETLTDSNICQDFDKFADSVQKDSMLLKGIAGKATSRCLFPCTTSTFEAKLLNYHKNARLLLPPQFSISTDTALGIFYEQFIIEHQNEYLVVDGGILISGIGGFLGLFLGSSMLSISGYIIELLRKICKAGQ